MMKSFMMSLIAVFELQASIPISLAQLQMEAGMDKQETDTGMDKQEKFVFKKLLEIQGPSLNLSNPDATTKELFNEFLKDKYNLTVKGTKGEEVFQNAYFIFQMDKLIDDWVSTNRKDAKGLSDFLMTIKEENPDVCKSLNRMLENFTTKNSFISIPDFSQF